MYYYAVENHLRFWLMTHTTKPIMTMTSKIGSQPPPYPPIQPLPHMPLLFIMFPLCAKATPQLKTDAIPTVAVKIFFMIFSRIYIDMDLVFKIPIFILKSLCCKHQHSVCRLLRKLCSVPSHVCHTHLSKFGKFWRKVHIFHWHVRHRERLMLQPIGRYQRMPCRLLCKPP